MKRKTAIIITLLVLFLISATIAYTRTIEHKLSQNADYAIQCILNENNTTIEVLNSLKKSERYEVIRWIKKNPEKVSPFFYMYFADDLFAKNKKDGAFWFFLGRLRAIEDVQMCTDTTVQGQIDIYPTLAPKSFEYIFSKQNRNKKAWKKFVTNVINWDNSHPERVSAKWSCYYGVKSLSEEPTLIPAEEFKNIQNKTQEAILPKEDNE